MTLNYVLPAVLSSRPVKAFCKNALAEAGGALELGRHHRLQILHHAQPPLHFRHNPRLLGKGWKQEQEAGARWGSQWGLAY